jgi:predicted AAA+ superfamily ATPase
VGKSTWLHEVLPSGSLFFDLLDNPTYLQLTRNPEWLEALIGKQPTDRWICIDEIQRAPLLLNEVHRLIESKSFHFALSGSSARKLKRGGANLLAGRAIIRHMEPFSFSELKASFDLQRALAWGLLPLVVLNPSSAADILDAYVSTYIREEIKEEGLIRKVEPFLRFLQIAGLLNGQQLNLNNIAREAQIPRNTVETYFSILEDTLVGFQLPAYRPRSKVREQTHPKFYWFDSGVARAAAGLLYDPADPLRLGYALETFIYHELRVYNETHEKHRPLYYYRTAHGVEIDFVIERHKRTASSPPRVVCLEIKGSKRWDRRWEAPLREFAAQKSFLVEGMYGIYMGEQVYDFGEVRVFPVEVFLKRLYDGQIF